MLTIAFVVSAISLRLLAAASPAPTPDTVQHITLTRRQDSTSASSLDVQFITNVVEATLE